MQCDHRADSCQYDPDATVAACDGAALLVTNNTKGLKPAVPPSRSDQPNIVTTDEFVCSLLDVGVEDDIVNVISSMISVSRRPPQTWDAIRQRQAPGQM